MDKTPTTSRASPAPEPSPPLGSRYTTWLQAVIVCIAFIATAAWTWNRWPDILVDFGRELYIAWQISEGKHLYTDIAYYSGPLSPHLNALWFKCFGVGLHTLTMVNLALLAAFVALLFRMVADIADRFAATVGCIVFILLFAFAQYVGIGNYNWVCPYSHDAIHGIMLSLLSLFLMGRYNASHRVKWLAMSGLALGLTFLTRSEVFVAAVAAVASSLGLGLWSTRRATRDWRRAMSVLLACTAIAPVVAYGLLTRNMPSAQSLTAVLGTWPSTWAGRVASMTYFRMLMGTDDLGASIRTMLGWTAGYGILIVPAGAMAMLVRQTDRSRNVIAGSLLACTALIMLAYWWNAPPVENALRPLPLVALIAGIASFISLARSRRAAAATSSQVQRVAFNVFSLALLGKTILNAHIYHYGAFFAAPAMLVLLQATISWIPGALRAKGCDGGIFRSMMLGSLLAFTIVHLRIVNEWYYGPRAAESTVGKKLSIGAGPDQFWADNRAIPVQEALNVIDVLVGPSQTLVAMPEGVMLNYLSRRVNPTPHTNFMPTEMVIFGEEAILAGLRAHPPDWIALVHKDTSEFGTPFFARDYAPSIGRWISENYVEVRQILDRPLQDGRFGILFLRRR